MEMIIGKVIFDMQLCDMSKVSQTNYSYHIRKFGEFCDKPLGEVDESDVRAFLYYLRNQKGLGIGSVNYCHTCLKFLFQVTLDKHWNVDYEELSIIDIISRDVSFRSGNGHFHNKSALRAFKYK